MLRTSWCCESTAAAACSSSSRGPAGLDHSRSLGDGGVMQITASMLGGSAFAEISLPSSATLGELRSQVTEALDAEGASLSLVLGGAALPSHGDVTLVEAGLADGAYVVVVVGQAAMSYTFCGEERSASGAVTAAYAGSLTLHRDGQLTGQLLEGDASFTMDGAWEVGSDVDPWASKHRHLGRIVCSETTKLSPESARTYYWEPGGVLDLAALTLECENERFVGYSEHLILTPTGDGNGACALHHEAAGGHEKVIEVLMQHKEI